METTDLVGPTSSVLATVTPKAQPRSSTPTLRAAEPTTLDVPISGTEDEDPAEYFNGRADAGELLDPLVDNAETEEATKAEEFDRLAEFGVCGHAHSPRQEASDNTLGRGRGGGSGPQERRNQSTIRRPTLTQRPSGWNSRQY